MTTYLKGKDGKFAGSIGDGKTNAPVSPAAAPVPTSVGNVNGTPVFVFGDEIDLALSYHMTVKCNPPVPHAELPTAKDAVVKVAQGHGDQPVTFPDGTTVTAREVVDRLGIAHLSDYLNVTLNHMKEKA